MNVAVILCGEKKGIYEIISLSANTDPELVDYALAKTRGQLQNIFQIRGLYISTR